MHTLTHSQLRAIVARDITGSAPVGILASVDAKARKTGNPFGGITKTIRATGWVGADYGAAVAREGSRQGVDASGFTPAPLPWGTWDIPGRVIAHNGVLYLRTQTTPGMRRRSPARVLGYADASGRPLSREDVAPFLPAPAASRKQAEVGLSADAEGQVWVRTYAFGSIRRVRIAGRTYTLVPD